MNTRGITEVVEAQRSFFAKGATKQVAYRTEALLRMREWIGRHDAQIMDALQADLNKAPFESFATETGIVLDEIRHTLRHIGRWARDKRVGTPIKHFPSRSFIHPEPYGVALIMSPWNYPFMLTLTPLIGAVAAGNCAVVKPSTYAPHTSALIAAMAKDVFEEAHVAVVEGGRAENESLLSERFDYIFFTGSVSVGKAVMAAAAKHLTPVTLELGGKSPCIVDETADVKLAARRIVWGKYLNAGQTCVAPDYLLVHQDIKEALVREMIAQIGRFYGDTPCENGEYPRMINEKHFRRVLGLLEGANILHGGGGNERTLQIAPTLADGITWESPAMREEIFGPLLPILTFSSLEEAMAQVSARPKPLALYFFTNSTEREAYLLTTLSFGGGCINDTIVHLATSHMPFGGVGESGMGGYHGRASFDTFSHKKSILKKARWLDLPMRYPPYRKLYLKLVRML